MIALQDNSGVTFPFKLFWIFRKVSKLLKKMFCICFCMLCVYSEQDSVPWRPHKLQCFPVFWSRLFANLKQILLFLGCFVMSIVWLNDLTCDFVQLCCNWAKFLNFVQNLQMICNHPNKPQRVVNFKMFYCWIVDRYLAYTYLLILSSYLFNTS